MSFTTYEDFDQAMKDMGATLTRVRFNKTGSLSYACLRNVSVLAILETPDVQFLSVRATESETLQDVMSRNSIPEDFEHVLDGIWMNPTAINVYSSPSLTPSYAYVHACVSFQMDHTHSQYYDAEIVLGCYVLSSHRSGP